MIGSFKARSVSELWDHRSLGDSACIFLVNASIELETYSYFTCLPFAKLSCSPLTSNRQLFCYLPVIHPRSLQILDWERGLLLWNRHRKPSQQEDFSRESEVYSIFQWFHDKEQEVIASDISSLSTNFKLNLTVFQKNQTLTARPSTT